MNVSMTWEEYQAALRAEYKRGSRDGAYKPLIDFVSKLTLVRRVPDSSAVFFNGGGYREEPVLDLPKEQIIRELRALFLQAENTAQQSEDR